jgi:hypothetical protein
MQVLSVLETVELSSSAQNGLWKVWRRCACSLYPSNINRSLVLVRFAHAVAEVLPRGIALPKLRRL